MLFKLNFVFFRAITLCFGAQILSSEELNELEGRPCFSSFLIGPCLSECSCFIFWQPKIWGKKRKEKKIDLKFSFSFAFMVD